MNTPSVDSVLVPKVGEIVIWRPGVIRGMGVLTMTGTVQREGKSFFQLESESGKLFVPPDEASKMLHRPIAKAEAEKIVAALRAVSGPNAALRKEPFAKRYPRYEAALLTGTAQASTQILTELGTDDRNPELSFGERKFVDLAHTALVGELAASLGISTEAVQKRWKN